MICALDRNVPQLRRWYLDFKRNVSKALSHQRLHGRLDVFDFFKSSHSQAPLPVCPVGPRKRKTTILDDCADFLPVFGHQSFEVFGCNSRKSNRNSNRIGIVKKIMCG